MDDMRYHDEEVDLRSYLNVILRRRWLIGIIAGIVLLGVIVATLMTAPVYKSTSTIQIYEKGGSSTSIESMLEETFAGGGGLTKAAIQTQVEILKSRTVSERAAKASNYQIQVQPEHRMIGILIDRFRKRLVNLFASEERLAKQRAIRPVTIQPLSVGSIDTAQSYELTFDSPDSFTVRGDAIDKSEGKGKLNEPFFGPGFYILVEGDHARKGKTIRFRVLPLSSATESLRESLDVSPIRNTELVTISATALRPVIATAKVNSVVSEYKKLAILKNTEDADRALRFIDEQIGILNKSLRSSENRLMMFKEKEKMVSLSDDARVTLEQLIDSDTALKQIENLRKQAEFIANTKVAGMSDSSIVALGANMENPRLNALAQRLSELRSRMVTLKISYKEKHPLVVETAEQIKETKKEIDSELSSVIASLKVNEQSIKENISIYEKRIKDLPDAEKRLAELTRETGVQQSAYSSLLQKKQEFEIIKASEIGNVWVVDRAGSAKMTKPRTKRNIMLAVIVGLFMGIGLAFFLEYFDNTINNPEDLKQITDIPLLGSVIKFDTNHDGDNAGELITHSMPKANVSEAFRTVRTNVFFTSFDTPKKLIGVTSALPKEGKTLVLANLAVSVAQADKKVLIIDADMRRPRMHRVFNQKRTPGLSNIIMSDDLEGTIADATQTLSIPGPGVDVICSGDIPHNPSEMLGSQKMERIIEILSEKYDYIFFDGPPVLSVSDSLVLSKQLDGILFVVSAENTEKNAFKQAMETFQNGTVLGLILNKVNIARDGYYYRYYYQYYYSYEDQDQGREKKRKKVRKQKTPQDRAKTLLTRVYHKILGKQT
ncbi:MAG: polysaccharide biosynthesis tyrosine autokinase [Syntrophobacterales bacterium]|nr:polysaccharide biosynthesis tyrosine autokinase [Syntrophobacterales bacterium]